MISAALLGLLAPELPGALGSDLSAERMRASCARHFSNPGCEGQGTAFFQELSQVLEQGRALCRDRYTTVEYSELEKLGGSLAQARGDCASAPEVTPECPGDARVTGTPAIAAISRDAYLVARKAYVARAQAVRDSYSGLMRQLPRESACHAQLGALQSEIAKTENFELCPSALEVMVSSEEGVGSGAVPQSAAASVAAAAPKPVRRSAPEKAVAEASESDTIPPKEPEARPEAPIEVKAHVVSAPGEEPVASPFKLPADWPPECALDALKNQAIRQKRALEDRTWLDHVAGWFAGSDEELSNPDDVIADPRMAFSGLEPAHQQKFLMACTPEQLMKGAGQVMVPPRPPRCAIDALVKDVIHLKSQDEARNWVERQYAHLTGEGAPANSDEILANPEWAFSMMRNDSRVRYLGECPPEEIRATVEAALAPLQEQIAGVSDGERVKTVQVPWPPACALNAMTTEISTLKKEDDERTWLGRRFAHLFGDGAPENAEEILKHPEAAFMVLDEEAQQGYLAKCSMTELKRELDPQGVSEGEVPACAANALAHEVSRLKKEDDESSWLGRRVNHLVGDAPPENAEEVLANPSAALSALPKEEQTKYVYRCAPAWVRCAGEELGFFGKIRNYLQHMGFLGKTAFVLGAALFGGILWRIRGGFLPTGSTQTARLIGTLPLALMGGLLLGPGGFVAGLSMFITTAIWGWGSYFQTKDVAQTTMMGVRGLFQTAIPGLLLTLAGGSPLYIVAGLMMGGIYRYANKVHPNANVAGKSGFIDGPTSLAEVMTGAWLYGTFALAALTGTGVPVHHPNSCPPN